MTAYPTSAMASFVGTDTAQWPAELRLELQRRAHGTRVVQCRHHGPLRLQRPFYPEGGDCAHLYLLHPPGGLVSGDTLTIDLQLGEGSAALVTTPGAGRVYRARAQCSLQMQSVRLRVGCNATLEWLPLETIVFDGADVALSLDIELAAGACFAGWEVVCLGRQAGDLPFRRGRLRQRWNLLRDGRPLLRERLDLEADAALMRRPWGLAGAPVYGTFVVVGPEGWSTTTIEALRELTADAADCLAVTQARGVLILRYRGDSGEQATALFRRCWAWLRPQFNGRAACAPRIWNT
jgi:urease accessory protein